MPVIAALINGLHRPPMGRMPASVPLGARAVLGMAAMATSCVASAQAVAVDGEGCALSAKLLFATAGLGVLALSFVGLCAVLLLVGAAVQSAWEAAVNARAQQLTDSGAGRCPWCGCVGPGFHLSPRPADYCHHDLEAPL